MTTPNSPEPVHSDPDIPPDSNPPVVRSSDLFAGAREVLIQHGKAVYRLKRTSNDKLILTR